MKPLTTLWPRIKYLTLLLLVAVMPLFMGTMSPRELNAAETVTVSFHNPYVPGSGGGEYYVAVWLTQGGDLKNRGTYKGSIGHLGGNDGKLRYLNQLTNFSSAISSSWANSKLPNGSDAKMGATQSGNTSGRIYNSTTTPKFLTVDVSTLPNGKYKINLETVRHDNHRAYAITTVEWDKDGSGFSSTLMPVDNSNTTASQQFKDVYLTYTTSGTPPPVFTTNLAATKIVTAPASAAFFIAATGATSYQWYRGNTAISGQTGDSYTLVTTNVTDNGATFKCIATGAGGDTTSIVSALTVNNAVAPTVTNPTAQSVVAPNTATFSVTATSLVGMTYQWKVSTTGSGGTYNNVTGGSGATTANYTTAATATTDDGKYYRCVVTNSSNGNLATTSSSALLTVSAAVVAPNITADPVSVIKTVGQTATFSVTATGSPLNYQWKKNGSTNVGTNSSTYSFTCALADDGTSYSCVVSNTAGTDTSATANLTVNAPLPLPVITGAATASVYENNAFNYAFTLSGSPTACTASGLPTGLSLTSNATSGAITGTPTVSGVFPVTITATNATGDGTKDIEITVIGKPVITSSTSESVLVNTAFSYTITATNTPTSFTATGLPAELTLTNGVISGTPTSLTTYSVTIRAANAAGNSTAVTLSINVNDGSTPPPAAPAEPKKCGYGAGLSTFLLMIMASLSLMISNRRGTKRD